ncbi:MAG TPA: lanthionine synthetase LanC family protein [Puia sp.]|nr:lanthionine synthetase LanC family protein [Puia sp.]
MQSEVDYDLIKELSATIAPPYDYSELLSPYGISFRSTGNYWQVGETKLTQGWILHLSAVVSQIEILLTRVIPVIIQYNTSFKIIKNDALADDLVNGSLGVTCLGKLVSIYAASDEIALDLAIQLVQITVDLKGPAIPTDFCLSNVVYTRYGSFNPIVKINPAGQEERYIYDNNNSLVRDNYEIPFRFPTGVPWPFSPIAKAVPPKRSGLLNRLYKPIELLKGDPRGNVFRGLFVKGFFSVKPALIKQGYQNMASDRFGRDMKDRLQWQFELHGSLNKLIPLPEVYAFLEEKEYSVLIMEWIKGVSLFEKVGQLNASSACWEDMPHQNKERILKYCFEIIQIIGQMHKAGYVHRDIVPVNFMIDQNDQIRPIDIELAFSLKQHKPRQPFALGTYGFMSPQQAAKLEPTPEEDIYGLGATLIFLFTGLFPVKFTGSDTSNLLDSLVFFTGDKALASVLASTFCEKPQMRPTLNTVALSLSTFRKNLKTSNLTASSGSKPAQDSTLLDLISAALGGLTKPPIPILNDIWYSRRITAESILAREDKEFTISPGFSDGLSGTLYLLSKLKQTGLNIDGCTQQFQAAWRHIIQTNYPALLNLPTGLFNGTAGLALAIYEGMESNMLGNEELHQRKLSECLDLSTEALGIAGGISGIGLSLIHCRSRLDSAFYKNRLETIVAQVLSKQIQDGVWADGQLKIKPAAVIPDIYQDSTGIIWFLLAAKNQTHSSHLEDLARLCLSKMLGHKQYMQHLLRFIGQSNSFEVGDGGKGLIATLIFAFEMFGDHLYKEWAERLLLNYPARPVHNNFDLHKGLAALGDLYLEAWRVFRKKEWKNRADWIANVLKYTFIRNNIHSGYWKMDQNNVPTAALLTGNGGIIHFLCRKIYPERMGYFTLR